MPEPVTPNVCPDRCLDCGSPLQWTEITAGLGGRLQRALMCLNDACPPVSALGDQHKTAGGETDA